MTPEFPAIYLPIHQTLNDGTAVDLDFMRPQDEEAVRALLNQIVIDEQTYPQDRPLSQAEFAAYWMVEDAFVVRSQGEILGAFYLKPNFPGRSRHICNAGFIVRSPMRGKGLGRWMGETMLAIAGWRGYTAVIFNLVFETNKPSIALWRSLGFTTIGRIPHAAKMPDGHFVDAYILYRSLLGP